jgi:hypothetical protein
VRNNNTLQRAPVPLVLQGKQHPSQPNNLKAISMFPSLAVGVLQANPIDTWLRGIDNTSRVLCFEEWSECNTRVKESHVWVLLSK